MGLVVWVILLPWLLIGFGGWLFVQALRQNGRILLRLEAIEEALNEWAEAQSGHASRNGRYPVAGSRLKRDGLAAGSPAPDFRLPRLDGGELSLSELRGRRLLLVFSDPHCGPCDALAPELERTHRKNPHLQLLMVSRSEIAENWKKVKEHGLTFPILLQKKWEIHKLYAHFATPIAYLIDEEGVIAADVAVGGEAILALLSGTRHETEESGALVA